MPRNLRAGHTFRIRAWDSPPLILQPHAAATTGVASPLSVEPAHPQARPPESAHTTSDRVRIRIRTSVAKLNPSLSPYPTTADAFCCCFGMAAVCLLDRKVPPPDTCKTAPACFMMGKCGSDGRPARRPSASEDVQRYSLETLKLRNLETLHAYQISQILSAGRTIGASGLHWNAFGNSGRFPSGPITRYFAIGCGSVCTINRCCSGRI